MKRWKLPPLLTLTITLEMVVSPIAYGQRNALQMVNMVGQAIQQNQMALNASRQAQANQSMIAQMTTRSPDKFFKNEYFSQIPGFRANMACSTLPATLTEIRAEVRRLGVTNDRGVPPQAQLSEMYSLYKTYGDVSKAYENYRSTSNVEGQGFGVGCMKNAMLALNGFLTQRINDLDKTLMEVAFINDKFKERSRADLDAITEATAVLDGPSELFDEAGSNSAGTGKDLLDFGKRFGNPACKSMYEGDKINSIGRRSPGGLNAISKDMRNNFSARSGKFSGESYVGAHASVIEDINKMADNVAKQFNLNFTAISEPGAEGRGGYGSFLGSLRGSISSSSGLTGQFTNDFFAESQQSYNEQSAKINNDLRLLSDELSAAGVNPARAAGLARNLNASNFDSEVNLVQNQLRHGCVQRAFGGDGFWNDLKRNIRDPEASKFANKSYENFRDRVQAIMTDPRTTPEAKIEAVKSLERSEGSRFVLNMQGGYQTTSLDANGSVVKKNVNPNSSAPSDYFSNVVSTCDAQFNTNKLGSTLTGTSAIQKLRTLNQQYKSLAQNQANKLRADIRKKLIECDNKNEANNQQAGSCTPDRFNTGSPGFCANAAFTCASNMKSCTEQAEQLVTSTKAERGRLVRNYKANMEKNKNDIKNMVAGIFRDYSAIGKSIADLNFGAGFNFPFPDLNVGPQFLDKFKNATQNSPDGALLLEDPDKYVDLIKKNLTGMKTAFQTMQTQLNNRNSVLAQHMQQTEDNYKRAQDEAKRISESCIAKHDEYIKQSEQQRAQQVAEQQKKMNELGEKRQEFCDRFSMLNSNPSAACEGQIRDYISVGLRVSQTQQDRDRIQEFSRNCQQNQSQTDASRSGGDKSLLAERYCADYRGGSASGSTTSDQDAIKTYCAQLTTSALRTEYCTREPGIPARDDQPAVEGRVNCDTIFNRIIVAAERLSRNRPGNNSAQTREPGVTVSNDSGGAPAFCTAGYNGDRFDGSGAGRQGGPMMDFFETLTRRE